jgi:hypothetical protein
MTKIDPCDTMRNNLIAAALGLQHCTKTAANIVPIPSGKRFVVIGTASEVSRLLEIAPAAAEQPMTGDLPTTTLTGEQLHGFYVDAPGGVDEGLVAVANAAIAAYIARQPAIAAPTVPAQQGIDALAMARQFLGWKMPKDFSPDGGISFKPYDMPHMWPIGTNLLNEDQAKAMFEHCLKGAVRPADDHLWNETLRDRDTYHEWADKLANAIAKYFGAEIGEHSNMNCPWAEALDVIEYAAPAIAARVVPEGWRLVPTKLTREMRHAWDRAPQNEDDDIEFAGAYQAMIAAAPQAPAAQEAVEPSVQAAGDVRDAALEEAAAICDQAAAESFAPAAAKLAAESIRAMKSISADSAQGGGV